MNRRRFSWWSVLAITVVTEKDAVPCRKVVVAIGFFDVPNLLQVPGVQLNGHVTQRSCHIVNVSVDGVEGESLRCGLRDIALSSGSACAAESGEPSPVLRTLGRPDHVAQASLRFSLGRTSTMADVEASVAAFTATVARLRALAPA